jgi:hypothetical protein
VQSWVESHESAQSGAPLQLSVQSWVQPVIVHDCEPVHVRVQSFPAQSIEQEPPAQVCVQSPPAQASEQVALVHAWLQSPPGQLSAHVAPAAHWYWQSPLPGQVFPPPPPLVVELPQASASNQGRPTRGMLLARVMPPP